MQTMNPPHKFVTSRLFGMLLGGCVLLVSTLAMAADEWLLHQPTFTALPLALQEQSQPALTFRRPSSGPLPTYVQSLLERAYADLDYRLEYIDMPRQRSLVEANRGTIAGELARLPQLEDSFENLVRVNFPLYSFEIVMVADRRVCGVCNFERVSSFAYVNGVRMIESYLNEHPTEAATVAASDLTQLDQLLDSGRVQAVLMTNFEYQQSKLADNRHYIAVPLQRTLAYHYLNQQHAELAAKLETKLNQLHEQGVVEAKIAELGLELPRAVPALSVLPRIRVVADDFRTIGNSGDNNRYRPLIQAVFGDRAEQVEFNATNLYRAQQGMIEGRFDVMFGVYRGHQPPGTIVSQTHYDYDEPVYAFTKDLQLLAELKLGTLRRPVCVTRGTHHDEFLPESILYYFADNSLDCFALLDLDRVAAVIDYEHNRPEWFTDTNGMLEVHEGLPLHAVFADTERGHQLREVYETRLRELVRSGEINKVAPSLAHLAGAASAPQQ